VPELPSEASPGTFLIASVDDVIGVSNCVRAVASGQGFSSSDVSLVSMMASQVGTALVHRMSGSGTISVGPIEEGGLRGVQIVLLAERAPYGAVLAAICPFAGLFTFTDLNQKGVTLTRWLRGT
jgi:hypothetical protein